MATKLEDSIDLVSFATVNRAIESLNKADDCYSKLKIHVDDDNKIMTISEMLYDRTFKEVYKQIIMVYYFPVATQPEDLELKFKDQFKLMVKDRFSKLTVNQLDRILVAAFKKTIAASKHTEVYKFPWGPQLPNRD